MIVRLRTLESVPRPSYFPFRNVLHMWTIRAIPTYRVYDIAVSPLYHVQGGGHRLSELVGTTEVVQITEKFG